MTKAEATITALNGAEFEFSLWKRELCIAKDGQPHMTIGDVSLRTFASEVAKYIDAWNTINPY